MAAAAAAAEGEGAEGEREATADAEGEAAAAAADAEGEGGAGALMGRPALAASAVETASSTSAPKVNTSFGELRCLLTLISLQIGFRAGFQNSGSTPGMPRSGARAKGRTEEEEGDSETVGSYARTTRSPPPGKSKAKKMMYDQRQKEIDLPTLE